LITLCIDQFEIPTLEARPATAQPVVKVEVLRLPDVFELPEHAVSVVYGVGFL
jgi:hypothetical protein